MESESECLVRYGLTGHVGWFVVADELVEELRRGQPVVIRTSRGMELGQVLIEPSAPPANAPRRAGEDSIGTFQVVRLADADDLARRDRAERLREERFADCLALIAEAGWPIELIDVEPLLDPTTILHYLALDDVDTALIRARFRTTRDYDVNFEDLTAPNAAPKQRCGGGGCSRTKPAAAEPEKSDCSGCGVAELLKDRRAV